MPDHDIAKTFLQKIIRHINEDYSKRVTSLHIVLGELLELNPASLQTYWNELSKDTLAEQARLHIRLIPAEVQCMACFKKYQPREKKILCPYCGSFGAKILTGEERYLESVETE